MERFNGEVYDREKILRSVETNSPLPMGHQIYYYNYVRSHMALEGKTPSEVAGIEVGGKDEWLTIIQNAKARTAKPQ
jgi:hypothetical protein